MKTTIYDILGMIKDNKAPKKILFRGLELGYEEGLEDYFPAIETDEFNNDGLFTYLFDEEVKSFLNAEVTILETTLNTKDMNITSKKIEKTDVISYDECIHGVTHNEKQLALEIRHTQIKINEIIEVINDKLNKESDK